MFTMFKECSCADIACYPVRWPPPDHPRTRCQAAIAELVAPPPAWLTEVRLLLTFPAAACPVLFRLEGVVHVAPRCPSR